jgi:hypothetical protein
MNSFEVYQTYLALKLHFTNPDYDFFKYHGKVSASVDTFSNRKDRFFFEKLAKHNDPVGFLLANIISNPHTYVRDLAYSEDAKRVYLDWLKKKESLSYVFGEELSNLSRDFNGNFVCISGVHPPLLRLYLANKITLETLCILCDLTGCLKYWAKQMKGDIIYDDIELLVRKYTPFLQFDKEKFSKIIRNNFKETK